MALAAAVSVVLVATSEWHQQAITTQNNCLATMRLEQRWSFRRELQNPKVMTYMLCESTLFFFLATLAGLQCPS